MDLIVILFNDVCDNFRCEFWAMSLRRIVLTAPATSPILCHLFELPVAHFEPDLWDSGYSLS
jgi:hypothetical protein